MKRFLFDTNLFIDQITRYNEFPESIQCYSLALHLNHTIFMAMFSYTTIHYLVSKDFRNKGQPLTALWEVVKAWENDGILLLPLHWSTINLAKSLPIKDHEDACIAALALENNCDFIVTRNLKDFDRSPFPILSPKELLEAFKAELK